MATLTSGISLGNVAEILHAATVLGRAAWGSGSLTETHLASDVEEKLRGDLLDLFSTLRSRNVPFVMVGGLAMLRYVQGRNTQDLDLVISPDALVTVPEISLSDCNPNFGRGHFRSLRVGLLFTANPLFELVRRQYATVHCFLEIDVPCASVEGLILLKLYALPDLYRRGDGQRIGLYENDIYMLCERYRPAMEPIFSALRPHVSEDQMRELKSIAADIQKRIERVDRARQAQAPG